MISQPDPPLFSLFTLQEVKNPVTLNCTHLTAHRGLNNRPVWCTSACRLDSPNPKTTEGPSKFNLFQFHSDVFTYRNHLVRMKKRGRGDTTPSAKLTLTHSWVGYRRERISARVALKLPPFQSNFNYNCSSSQPFLLKNLFYGELIGLDTTRLRPCLF